MKEKKKKDEEEDRSPDWPDHKSKTLFKKLLKQNGLEMWLK
jgi:hypothetical protein